MQRNIHTHTHTHKSAECSGKGRSPAQKHLCPNTANSITDISQGITWVHRWLTGTKGSNVHPWVHCIQACLSEELLLQLDSPALVSPGSRCQVANVRTLQNHLHMSNTSRSSAHVDHIRIVCTCRSPQDHLHMSNISRLFAYVKHLKIICTCRSHQDCLHMSITSGSSAHVKDLKIICTGQTQLHCTRHAQDSTHLHMD